MPDVFNIGPVLVPTLRASIIVALLFAIWVAARIAGYMNLESGLVRRVAETSVWLGLIGARLGFVVTNWSAFRDTPWTALYFWQPGYLPSAGLLLGAGYALWRLRHQEPRQRLRYVRALGTSFALAALLVGMVVAATQIRFDPAVLRPGDPVPNFTLQTLDGKPVTFSSLQGQAVVLNFWATWCPPCRREMPLLDAVQKEYNTRGVMIVGIDLDEPMDLVRAYAQSVGVTYPIWVDTPTRGPEFNRAHELYNRFGGIGLPTTFFIDRNGVIRDSYIGELNRAFLQNRIEAMLTR
jgi:thiol-disulfide isomerase/thioredoxin